MSLPNSETSSNVGRNLILAPADYAKRLWDWTPFNECFPRGIRIGDVDGFVEIGGCFLILDGKPLGGEVKKGQLMAFTRLVALSERIAYVVLYGDPPMGVKGMKIIRKRYGQVDGVSYVADLAFALRFVRRWARAASQFRNEHP